MQAGKAWVNGVKANWPAILFARFTWERSIDQALESLDQTGIFKLSVELGLNDGAGDKWII